MSNTHQPKPPDGIAWRLLWRWAWLPHREPGAGFGCPHECRKSLAGSPLCPASPPVTDATATGLFVKKAESFISIGCALRDDVA
jgi:hypothetical protein